MFGPCPRCGSPRLDDRRSCATCGLDFGPDVAAQPAAATSGPPIGSCPRCGAPIYWGQGQCANCSLDLRSQYGVPAPAYVAATGSRRRPVWPLLAGGVAVAAMVAGGVFIGASIGRGQASPQPTATLAPTAAPTPATSPIPSVAVATAETASQPGGTPEPSPAAKWVKYTMPAGTWTASFPVFPGVMQTHPAGANFAMLYYTPAAESTVHYVVYDLDMNRDVATMESSEMIAYMDSYMRSTVAPALGGSVMSSRLTTLGGKPGLHFDLDAKGDPMTIEMTGVGKRLYILMVTGPAGTDMYPEHFFAGFAFK